VKKKKTELKAMPPLHGLARLQADTIDEESRTVELNFYSGAPVFRAPLFGDPYELEFEVTSKAANLGRLNDGASLINSHNTYSGVSSILGVVEKAWIEDGSGRATVRFSKRDEVEPVWQDVLDGVIRNVSMGVYILELEEVEVEDGQLERFRATSWEPYEISLVAVPADAGAQILNAADDAESRPCRIIHRAEADAAASKEGTTVKKIKVRLLADCELGSRDDIVEIDEKDLDSKLHTEDLGNEPDPERAPSAARTVDAAIEKDKAHRAELKRVASHYGMDTTWIGTHTDLGTPIDDAIEDAKNIRRERGGRRKPNDIGLGEDRDSRAWRVEQMGLALSARGMKKPPEDSARQYANTTLVECAMECLAFLGLHRGLDVRRDASRIVELALHSNSDFPLILADVLNKILQPEYDLATPTYRTLAQQRTFNDFRPHRFTRSGDFPVPLEVNEHGEYQHGTMGENQEVVTLATFGRIIGFTRQSLINDDLGAFADLATMAARRTSDFENAHFFTTAILAGAGLGPDLADGDPVYDANHGNLTAAGALANVLLEEAMADMLSQTSIDGLALNIMPRYLLVSPASLGLARRLLAPINPTVAADINPFAGQIEAIGDANLTGTRFYVLADPSQLANYIYGYLGSQAGPRTQVREGFDIDGVEFKLSLDFAVGAIDFRGGVSGAGA
jgi:hypothetical protein